MPINDWPSDNSRWNDAQKSDYGQTNNLKNAAYRTVNYPNKPFLDFYVTLQQPGDDINDVMRLPGAINIRVTRPIIANNAGGAGYLSVPDSYISLGDVTQGFLETLKAANFNTGNASNAPASTTRFNLKNIV